MKVVTSKFAALSAIAVLAWSPTASASGTPQAGKSATAPKTLPTGPATGFPFGYVKDEGTRISLPPPNDADVDQARVAKAHKLGPFHVQMSRSFAGWPSACSVSNAAQLQSLIAGVTGLRGKPVATKAEILGSGGNTPHPTDCKWNLKTTFDDSSQSVPSYVEVSFEEIDPGAPATWRQELKDSHSEAKKYPAQYAYYSGLPHGVACFYDGTELQCLKGDFDFWVTGEKFTSGSYPSADTAVWIDQAELPLAEVVADEVSVS